MHKEMESSVFFSIFQFDAVHEISGNEKNGRTGHQAESGRNIIFTEMLGRTVTETARTKSWDYSTVYDSRTSQDGRKGM